MSPPRSAPCQIVWLLLALLSTPYALSQSASPPDISECPCIRYVPWDSLPGTAKASAQALRYDSDTWDRLDFATAAVESNRWSDLSADERSAASQLGYDQRTWDCCVNHYEDYSWSELETDVPTIGEAMQKLGYTQPYWDGPKSRTPAPLVEVKTWCANVTSAEEDVCLTGAEVEDVKLLCYSPSEYRSEPMSGRGLVGGGGTRFVGPEHC